MTITAYFGDEDITFATLDCPEGADVCALVSQNIVGTDVPLTEAADACAIATGVGGTAALALQELADTCAAAGAITVTATMVITEEPDNVVIRAIAPTSIIGHGKKFKVKPHDPKSLVIPSS